MATKTNLTPLEPRTLGTTPLPPAPSVIDAGALLAQGIQQGLSVEAMERLLAMRRELQAEQARADFFAALATFQARIPAIPKNQIARVSSQKGSYSYRYADLADIQRAIAPVLADCGLSVTFDTEQDAGGYVIVAKVHHLGGHSERTTFRVPVDGGTRMNSAQAAGSALTYGRRYALCAALGIVTAEDDDDAQGALNPAPPPARPATAATPPAAVPSRHPPTPGAGPHPAPGADGDKGALPQSDAQHRRLEARIQALGLAPYRERLKAWTGRKWNVHSLSDLTSAQNQTLYDLLEDFAERIAIESEAAPDLPGARAAA